MVNLSHLVVMLASLPVVTRDIPESVRVSSCTGGTSVYYGPICLKYVVVADLPLFARRAGR